MEAVLVAALGVVGAVLVELIRRGSKKVVDSAAEVSRAASAVELEQGKIIELLQWRVALLEEALEVCKKRLPGRGRG